MEVDHTPFQRQLAMTTSITVALATREALAVLLLQSAHSPDGDAEGSPWGAAHFVADPLPAPSAGDAADGDDDPALAGYDWLRLVQLLVHREYLVTYLLDGVYGVRRRLVTGDSSVGALSSATVRDLLAPVLQRLLPMPCPTRGDGGAATVLELLVKLITRATHAAAVKGRMFRESMALGDSDTKALASPSISVVAWLTNTILAASPPQSQAMHLELFRAWAAALRSPFVTLKHRVFRTLTQVLESALAAHRADAAEPVQWVEYLRSAPAERVQKLALRRLATEQQDAPMYSRYLQAMLEFASVQRYILGLVTSAAAAGRGEEEAGRGDAPPATPPQPTRARSHSASDALRVAVGDSEHYTLRFRPSRIPLPKPPAEGPPGE